MAKLRLLLADDSASMRSHVRELLAEEFDIVGEVSSGDAVVDAAKALLPDAIVLDITMPGISGIEAARLLREDDCDCAIVFLSVHRQQRIVRQALRTPGAGYVLKPDARTELSLAIRAVVDGISFTSSSLPSISPA
jgi:DNA-binding NarL/FixJ family response regulator